ncbi:Kinetochore protein Spc24 [Malassezia vespertilionis]|uniref:Kri1-like C-terminal domain-containing protein n=1 Tax=Malassezia vespertilionis TaxID=2020962 RepID=A0A2N1JF84_9BASI|nr:Kinetochore protein Spc24 [Malassezia vespertilionis]PKI85221.1 hypothetical protein MVES_001373 [Malassezia vespertilionis]WFD06115.1 Kinetochore protein Spc24 [Malassezia vespertilionis]
MDLLGEDTEVPDTFSINESYAQRYQHNKRRMNLEQLQQKYGENAELEDSDSESDVTEDEEGDQLTPHVDAAILRTLQRIRSKDPNVYKSSEQIYDEEMQKMKHRKLPEPERKSKSKRVTLQDYQRSRMQEAMETEDDPARAFAEATIKEAPQALSKGPTHDDEQEAIRKEFLSAAEDEANTDLFQVRNADADDEKDAYKQTLMNALGESGEDDIRKALGDTISGTGDMGISAENQDFLLNYVLNRGWVDTDTKGNANRRDWEAEAADLDSEASFDSAADAFEEAYNFRFEDPSLMQQNFSVQSFPRQSADSMRRTDDRRKVARQERAVRKKEEKEARMKELDQLKTLKRQSIADKLKQLRDILGDNQMDANAFENIDFEKDFDPDEHDRLMQAQFGDDYYGTGETEKPMFDDIEEIVAETEPEKKSKNEKKRKKRAQENEDDGMDADFIDGQAEGKLSKQDRKRLKKQEKKARSKTEAHDDQAVDIEDMDADKTDATTDEKERNRRAKELMDEYYGLGYEDIIGDVPTRFKYANVPKDTFGLSPVEILLADDKELNNLIGMKRLQPFRRGSSHPSNLKSRLKRFREDLETRTGEARPKPKRIGKKERQKIKAQHTAVGESED